MRTKTLNIRLEEQDIELYKHGARMAGLTVSEWIRRKCSDEPITMSPAKAAIGKKIQEQLRELSESKVVDQEFKEVPESVDASSETQDVPRDRNLRVVAGSTRAARDIPRTDSAQPSLPLSGVASDTHPRDCRCRVCEFARDAGIKPPLPPPPKKEPKRVKEKEKGRRR